MAKNSICFSKKLAATHVLFINYFIHIFLKLKINIYLIKSYIFKMENNTEKQETHTENANNKAHDKNESNNN